MMTLIIKQFSSGACYFLPLQPKYLPTHPFLFVPSINILPLMCETKFYEHKNSLTIFYI